MFSKDCLLSRACLIRISVTGLSFPYATTTYMTASSKAAKESWASASLALATCSLCSSSTYFVNEDELLLSSWYVYASCKSNWWQVAGLQQPEQLHEDTLCHMQPWYIASTKKRPHTLHRSSTLFACIHSKILKLFIKTPALFWGYKKSRLFMSDMYKLSYVC